VGSVDCYRFVVQHSREGMAVRNAPPWLQCRGMPVAAREMSARACLVAWSVPCSPPPDAAVPGDRVPRKDRERNPSLLSVPRCPSRLCALRSPSASSASRRHSACPLLSGTRSPLRALRCRSPWRRPAHRPSRLGARQRSGYVAGDATLL